MDVKSDPVIFKDDGTMRVEKSLSFYEAVIQILNGDVVRLEAVRGNPYDTYNTRLYTDRNEEIWFSGFTCGKQHAGALGLCELVAMLGWDKYVSRKEIVNIVLSNNSFRMEFRPSSSDSKKKFYIAPESSVESNEGGNEERDRIGDKISNGGPVT